MSLNATLTWKSSPSPNVTEYDVAWTQNGSPAATVHVPRTPTGDSSGYSVDFASGNPSLTVQGGDVIDCTITAVDTKNSLSSVPTTPPAVTEPVSAPLAPAAVVLALS